MFNVEIDVFYIGSQIFALVALILNLLAVQNRRKVQIINFGVVGGACAMLHYLLLGAWPGVATKAVGTVRNAFAAYESHKHKRSKILPLIFVSFYIAGGFLTYESAFSMLPIIAASLYTISIYLGNAMTIRYVAGISSGLWLIYNFHVMSVVGIVSEIVFITNDLIAIYRYLGKKAAIKK